MERHAYTVHAQLEVAHWWFTGRRAILEKVISSMSLPDDPRLVELGAGTGGNLAMLRERGRVTAVEIDDEARGVSISREPLVEHARTLDDVSAGDAFDAAFAFDVLEHLDDPIGVLRDLAAWMAPAAPLVVTVPAIPFLFGPHDRFHHHRRRYNERELRAHLELGGFVVDRISSMNSLLVPLAFASRALSAVREAILPASSRQNGVAPPGLSMPPAPLNRALASTFALEAKWLPERSLPVGLSLIALAHRGESCERT